MRERIEIVEIGDARQHRHRDRDAARLRGAALEIDRVLGRQPAASGSHGTTPRQGQPVSRSIAATPSSNRLASPRNLLIRKPRMRARSDGSSTAMGADEAGDDAAAIDVADEHHRHVGCCRKAHVGDVAGAQIDLRRAAGALDQNDIGVARRDAAKLSSTAGSSSALRCVIGRARASCRRGVPCTITCAPVSVSGLSSTGFMWTLGDMPAARACTACARPISPPSTVTAALFDMFCGLNGATFRPRRTSARAQARDQGRLADVASRCPGSSPRASARSSELDTLLRLHAGRNGCLISVISVTRSAISISAAGRCGR